MSIDIFYKVSVLFFIVVVISVAIVIVIDTIKGNE